MLTVYIKKQMLLNSIKIGIVVGAFAFATFAVTDTVNPPDDTVARNPERLSVATPPCLQMYQYIKAYADTFNIPLRFAFGIAHTETGYRGPMHWRYQPGQTSSAGAVGPMQVMVATARYINRDHVTKDRLRTDIEYNVRTSMKLLRRLYDRRHDWKVVFGEYNTGRPCINGYSHKVYNHKLNW
jgi:soluble lytic murein transglycosylase-like protein